MYKILFHAWYDEMVLISIEMSGILQNFFFYFFFWDTQDTQLFCETTTVKS